MSSHVRGISERAEENGSLRVDPAIQGRDRGALPHRASRELELGCGPAAGWLFSGLLPPSTAKKVDMIHTFFAGGTTFVDILVVVVFSSTISFTPSLLVSQAPCLLVAVPTKST